MTQQLIRGRSFVAAFSALALTGLAIPALSNPAQAETTEPKVTPIADIQGDGNKTPLKGQNVTTKGVVTASYPTGGLRGYNLQAPGTGGTVKTEGKSDGIFVYTGYKGTPLNIGDCALVTGKAIEFRHITELSGTTAKVLDKSECEPVTAYKLAEWPATDAEREQYESMLVAPQGSYTVVNNYDINKNNGQIGLAFGDTPLMQGTEVAAPGDAANAVEAQNQARAVNLDDGATINFRKVTDQPLPYLTLANPVRVGAAVTFKDGVILDNFDGKWAFRPRAQQVADKDSKIEFENTRTASPKDVGGDVKIGSFNVLNYFTDLGKDEAKCKYYADREGNPTNTNWCKVRGAYDQANFERQEAKIVAAINALDADVVALQEIENSSNFSHDRDASLSTLVDALNADLGAKTWSFVASPSKVPNNGDAIRTAFIYKGAKVKPVGDSTILDDPAFEGTARSPLAQKFEAVTPKGVKVEEAPQFVLINNHFKSKGSIPKGMEAGNKDSGDGQGNNVALRVAQATALAKFANSKAFADNPVFLMGDFNSYSKEDPITTLQNAGFADLTAGAGNSYVYKGRVGSLDHIMGNAAAQKLKTGADIWEINANEPVLLEYSRYNTNVTPLYADDVYRSSDHNPAVMGLKLFSDEKPEEPTETQPSSEEPSEKPSEPSSEEPSEEPSGTEPSSEEPSVEPSEPGIKVPDAVFRLGAQNRYTTAAQIADIYASGADTVYVATGASYPDALTAAAIAGHQDAPVLLVQKNSIDPKASAAIKKLDPNKIIIVGGPGAVSNKVETALKDLKVADQVKRITGQNRFVTASNLATDAYQDGTDIVYLAAGLNFPDALSASAAAAHQGAPVLLAMKDQLPTETKAALKTLKPKRVIVVGGQGVVTDAVAKQAAGLNKSQLDRYAGANRFATAQDVAQKVFGNTGVPLAVVADGMKFPDALVGAAVAGAKDGPVLLTQTNTLNAETNAALKHIKPASVMVAGGESAISNAVKAEIAKATGLENK